MPGYGARIAGPFNSGAGTSSNADSNHPVSGFVYAVYVKYNHSPGAGTDVVVKTSTGTAPPSVTILSLTNANTDGWFYPREEAHTTTGAALTFDSAQPVPTLIGVDDVLNVSIAGAAGAEDNVDVWLILA